MDCVALNGSESRDDLSNKSLNEDYLQLKIGPEKSTDKRAKGQTGHPLYDCMR